MKKQLFIKLLVIDAMVTLTLIALIWRFVLRSPILPAGDTPQDVPTAYDSTRIVSMAPNLTELLFALGLEKQIIAVTSDSNFPPQALSLPRVGTFWQPDIEAIIAAKPTLVITLGFEQQSALAAQLGRIGCKTLSLNIESFPELFDGIKTLGQALDRPLQSTQLFERIRSACEKSAEKFKSSSPPKVLWVIQRQPLRVAGTDTFANDLIKFAGGQNAIGKTINIYPPISDEQVIASAPDVIIEPADTPRDIRRLAESASQFYSRYHTAPAVLNNRIYVLDGDLVSRLGPRIDQGLYAVCRCLWPESKNE